MRALGVDFGSKRIGIAVAVSGFGIASARPALAASGRLATDAAAIQQLALREEAKVVVVGIPFNEEDPRMAKVCGLLAEQLRGLGLTVDTVDESLTSVAAESAMRQTDLKASERRKRRDGEAACQILERWMRETGS